MQPIKNTQTSFSLNSLFTGFINKPWKVVALTVAGVAFLAFGAYVASIISLSKAFAITLCTAGSVGYLFFKNRIEQKTTATLASEIGCAKNEILARIGLKDSDLTDAKSAKLFLVIKHGGKVFSNTVILPQDVNKEQVLKHVDTLIFDIQKDIIFNSVSETKVNIGILAKGKDYYDHPTFSYKLTAHATAHYGEASNPGWLSSTKVLASNDVQNSFCDVMEINRAPQIDDQGNFI